MHDTEDAASPIQQRHRQTAHQLRHARYELAIAAPIHDHRAHRRSPDPTLRVRAKNPLVADQVAVNYRKADITERQRAMLDFAMKVSQRSGEVREADFEPLRAHGWSDEDIWDIAAISAFFALSNRMANVLDMRPNDEFYLMGRVKP